MTGPLQGNRPLEKTTLKCDTTSLFEIVTVFSRNYFYAKNGRENNYLRQGNYSQENCDLEKKTVTWNKIQGPAAAAGTAEQTLTGWKFFQQRWPVIFTELDSNSAPELQLLTSFARVALVLDQRLESWNQYLDVSMLENLWILDKWNNQHSCEI